jgi:Flagellar motor component
MFAIIGLVIVLGAVIGGYLLEGGNLHVLWQPVELLIILGSGVGVPARGLTHEGEHSHRQKPHDRVHRQAQG